MSTLKRIFFQFSLIASLVAFLFTQDLWASEKTTIRGYLVLESDPYRFIEANTLKSFKLRIATESAKQAIQKLHQFDAIQGVASLVNGDTYVLESIEFVGLRKLIGKWQSPAELYQFLDYNRLAVTENEKTHNLSYALSPGQGNAWRMFFTDENSVAIGSLKLENEVAQIEIFDPESGQVSRTLPLTRVKE